MIEKRTSEEIANTLTHLLGLICAIAGSIFLLIRSYEAATGSLFPMIIFCAGMIMLYAASTLYHWAIPGKTKRVLRRFDHINIYVLIAASYTPIWLIIIGGTYGWVAFIVMWAIALAGAVGKLVALGKFPKLSLAIYLIMGWAVVLVAKPVWDALPAAALYWLLLEAVSYTAGTYFYAKDETKPFYHAIWHLFVLSGTLAHFMVMWLILKPTEALIMAQIL